MLKIENSWMQNLVNYSKKIIFKMNKNHRKIKNCIENVLNIAQV